MIDIYTAAVPGPLGIHKQGLGSDLLKRGYSPLSVRNLLRLTAHLSRWIDEHGIRLERLAVEDIDSFVTSRKQESSRKSMSRAALAPILSYLRRCGAVPASDLGPAQEQLPTALQDYHNYLSRERALTDSTTRHYLAVAQRLLVIRGSRPIDVAGLAPPDVLAFIQRDSKRYSTGTAKLHVTAVRAFLRYLYVTEQIARDLSTMVPSIAGWRQTGLPRGLKANEVQRLLATCDRRTHTGRTDFALLLLLIRLGLRCCEAAALELNDIDWRQGQITIRGKGCEERLPLPEDVGQALIRHLRVRPRDVDDRHVFLRRRAPMAPWTVGALKRIVRNRMYKAGISPPHPHRLRHTAATRMLNRGASLDQVAQVLRHRSVDTTAIYTKVDHRRLRELCQPWPEVDHE